MALSRLQPCLPTTLWLLHRPSGVPLTCRVGDRLGAASPPLNRPNHQCVDRWRIDNHKPTRDCCQPLYSRPAIAAHSLPPTPHPLCLPTGFLLSAELPSGRAPADNPASSKPIICLETDHCTTMMACLSARRWNTVSVPLIERTNPAPCPRSLKSMEEPKQILSCRFSLPSKISALRL